MLEKGQIRIEHDDVPYFYPQYSSERYEIHDGDEIEYDACIDDWKTGVLRWNGFYWECFEEYGKFGPISALNARMDI